MTEVPDLDSFCGSGSSLVTANKMNRYWIGVDQSKEAIKTTKSRLENNNYSEIN